MTDESRLWNDDKKSITKYRVICESILGDREEVFATYNGDLAQAWAKENNQTARGCQYYVETCRESAWQ